MAAFMELPPTIDAADIPVMDAVPIEERKMWLLVRRDIDMSPGKLAAQAGHGFVNAMLVALEMRPEAVRAYMEQSCPKIAVAVKSEAQLITCIDACRALGLPVSLIEDAGRTELQSGTRTVGCVGPCFAKELPASVSRLRLYQGPVIAP